MSINPFFLKFLAQETEFWRKSGTITQIEKTAIEKLQNQAAHLANKVYRSLED